MVYDALATVSPHHFEVLTAKNDYVTGREVSGWEAYDAIVPYKIMRIPWMRPTLEGGAKGPFQRFMKLVENWRVNVGVKRALRQALASESFDTVCIGALDALGWTIGPIRRYSTAKVVLYTHGEEISQKAYSARADARRRKALEAADGIIAVSSFTARLITEKYGIAPSKIEVVTNGVDLPKFAEHPSENVRASLGLGQGPLVLSVGRLVPRKGMDKLLEAWPRVLAAVPSAQLAIGGTGPLFEGLQAEAGRAEMQGSIHLLGHVPDDLMPSLYASADLFTMPNRTMPDGDTEGFGLVFLEAAAAGTPSVGGNAGGAVDAIIDGETGCLVDGNDVGAIAFAVIDLLTDEAKRKKMAAAAREHALTQGWDSKAEQLLGYFDRLQDWQ